MTTKTERLSDYLSVRLTPGERVALEQRAAKEGSLPSSVARRLITAGLMECECHDCTDG